MKIDKEQLISFLSDRTGRDRSEIDGQLKQLIERIRQVEEDRSRFHIEGFGTFTAVQDRLEFDPADVFETEINNRYAGMKPIELIGAYKEPQSSGMAEADIPEEEEPEQPLAESVAGEDKQDHV